MSKAFLLQLHVAFAWVVRPRLVPFTLSSLLFGLGMSIVACSESRDFGQTIPRNDSGLGEDSDADVGSDSSGDTTDLTAPAGCGLPAFAISAPTVECRNAESSYVHEGETIPDGTYVLTDCVVATKESTAPFAAAFRVLGNVMQIASSVPPSGVGYFIVDADGAFSLYGDTCDPAVGAEPNFRSLFRLEDGKVILLGDQILTYTKQ